MKLGASAGQRSTENSNTFENMLQFQWVTGTVFWEKTDLLTGTHEPGAGWQRPHKTKEQVSKEEENNICVYLLAFIYFSRRRNRALYLKQASIRSRPLFLLPVTLLTLLLCTVPAHPPVFLAPASVRDPAFIWLLDWRKCSSSCFEPPN